MQISAPYQINAHQALQDHILQKDVFIVIQHASRIPPHIGLIAGKQYHSLTIKGHEIEMSLELLLKNIRIRKIPTFFILIKKHPVFSNDYLKEHFIQDIRQFKKVEEGGATCLSPLRNFFREAYDLDVTDVNFIFELLPKLEQATLIESVYSIGIESPHFSLPVYSHNDIDVNIVSALREASLIRKHSTGNL